jgi:hypothetical protein
LSINGVVFRSNPHPKLNKVKTYVQLYNVCPTIVVGVVAIAIMSIIVVTSIYLIAYTPTFAHAKNLAMVDSTIA